LAQEALRPDLSTREHSAHGQCSDIVKDFRPSEQGPHRSEAHGPPDVAVARHSGGKRVVDVIVASAALVLLSIPMAILSMLVARKLGSPVIFRQTRPGRNAQPFEMIKFRSMTDARDEHGSLLPDHQRITPFGARLRSSSLDELPELWNVLRGDMSLVGPRPLLTRYTRYFTEEESLRLQVRPGITGWAQVNGRNTTSWNDRLKLDVWYVRKHSLRLDAKIMLMTLTRVFRSSGVVVDPGSMMQDLDEERRDRTDAT